MDNYCAECGKNNITRIVGPIEYPYGIPPHDLMMVSNVPIYSCDDCGFQWTGYEADEIMDKDIQEYKKKNK